MPLDCMTMNTPLRRRYVMTGTRRVHLWTGGEGPALVLIHGSPGNAWLVKPLAEHLSRHFRVYAVDTPGFGCSDPLPGSTLTVASLADAYRDILDAIGLRQVAVYGTHSGAAFGLELARRHAARVSGFVLEGVPAFTLEEQQPLLAPPYMVALEPDVLGGHYSRAWTRFHDQFIWFPWHERDPAHLNEADAGTAADIHLWVEMYFQALRHDDRPAYRAAIGYGAEALAAAGEVRQPGVYLAECSDMLFSHLDRLPPPAAGQRIRRVMEAGEMPSEIAAALRSLPPSAAGVQLPEASPGSELSFFDLPHGQILVRACGGGTAAPVLLLHDAPGAGRPLTPLYAALSAHGRVLLPDLPGCGESDPLPGAVPSLADHADALAGLLRSRALPCVNVYAVGCGAALALELHARHPAMVGTLCLTGLLRVGEAERRAMIGRLAPRITLEDDGSHWYRTWLMLRDSLVHFPWYARDRGSLRRQPLDIDAYQLHAWTCDVMRQWNAYQQLVDAVLGWNSQAAIAAARDKIVIAVDPLHALHAADAAWAGSTIPSVILPADAVARARLLASTWT
jgi:pimeloyl-ACP methyl ester carboxylesterase